MYLNVCIYPLKLKQNKGNADTKSIEHVKGPISYTFSEVHFANEFTFSMVLVFIVVCRTNAILAKCSPVSHTGRLLAMTH